MHTYHHASFYERKCSTLADTKNKFVRVIVSTREINLTDLATVSELSAQGIALHVVDFCLNEHDSGEDDHKKHITCVGGAVGLICIILNSNSYIEP
jgi:hypothetical protein